jgi:Zn-dependent protease
LVEENPIFECACGAQVPAHLLSCPGCGRLPHAEKLKELVRQADRARETGDVRAQVIALRNALELLPADARQHQVIRAQIARLSEIIDAGQAPPTTTPTEASAFDSAEKPKHALLKAGSAVGVLAMLFWKFKFILVFFLTKAKLLLLGLSKSTTLFTMLLSLGVYWALWGWKFGLGVVLSIYVHEMGHVAELRKFGIRATAPMFIPGFGAMVRLDQYPQTAREDARVGLAGPIWGLGASIATLILYYLTQLPIVLAIATVGAWINLFNLMPFWQLDGARGFRSLSIQQRWIALGVIAVTGFVLQEGLLVLVGIGALMQCFAKNAPSRGDPRGLLTYVGLIVCLTLLSGIPVPGIEQP